MAALNDCQPLSPLAPRHIASRSAASAAMSAANTTFCALDNLKDTLAHFFVTIRKAECHENAEELTTAIQPCIGIHLDMATDMMSRISEVWLIATAKQEDKVADFLHDAIFEILTDLDIALKDGEDMVEMMGMNMDGGDVRSIVSLRTWCIKNDIAQENLQSISKKIDNLIETIEILRARDRGGRQLIHTICGHEPSKKYMLFKNN
ncbi:unnamed protein product [Amoebophrya sp. A25]|nr:unnamed protein product [Amoebophrya sp. A25]|eukprot:GSA25T00006894001.1